MSRHIPNHKGGFVKIRITCISYNSGCKFATRMKNFPRMSTRPPFVRRIKMPREEMSAGIASNSSTKRRTSVRRWCTEVASDATRLLSKFLLFYIDVCGPALWVEEATSRPKSSGICHHSEKPPLGRCSTLTLFRTQKCANLSSILNVTLPDSELNSASVFKFLQDTSTDVIGRLSGRSEASSVTSRDTLVPSDRCACALPCSVAFLCCVKAVLAMASPELWSTLSPCSSWRRISKGTKSSSSSPQIRASSRSSASSESLTTLGANYPGPFLAFSCQIHRQIFTQ